MHTNPPKTSLSAGLSPFFEPNEGEYPALNEVGGQPSKRERVRVEE
jgi:hypothetical protein